MAIVPYIIKAIFA